MQWHYAGLCFHGDFQTLVVSTARYSRALQRDPPQALETALWISGELYKKLYRELYRKLSSELYRENLFFENINCLGPTSVPQAFFHRQNK